MVDEADDNRVNHTTLRFRDFVGRNPAQHSISQLDLARRDHNNNMKCCCGRAGCAYLEHNTAALGDLEKDLETAARLGQALLDRHEAYVKESQAEQARLANYVHDLENEKASLQNENYRVVNENRELLQRLEDLNTDFGESGQRVHDLEHLLQDREQEVRRLNGLIHKAQELEVKVLDMEKERAELTKEVEEKQQQTRSTIVRWKESELRIRQLEQEVQKIEWAARLDRERHEELVARMERDRALDRELGLSEGRLKASAAVQTMQKGGVQKQVVSNFVRDILHDNANLQTSVAELRELLQTSNDEVQALRDQIMLHQPVHEDELAVPQRAISLSDEIGLSQPLPQKQVQQEVHVHHHYHTKTGAKKERTPRKPYRRAGTPATSLLSSPLMSGRSTPVRGSHRYSSSPAASLSVRPTRSRVDRWSTQSTATTSTYLSSIASSPTSYHERNGFIFDRLERGEESSRPTSPESFSIASPQPFKRQDRRIDGVPSVSEEDENFISDDQFPPLNPEGYMEADEWCDEHEEVMMLNTELTPKPSMALRRQSHSETDVSDSQIPEPPPPPDNGLESVEEDLDIHTSNSVNEPVKSEQLVNSNCVREKLMSSTATNPTNIEIRPSIRRSNSHDSLYSISGMDIHLAQQSSRTTLALLRGHGANKHHFAPTPAPIRQAAASAATQPLATVTEYTATSRPGLEATASPSMQALSGIHSHASRSNAVQTQGKGLIGSVGGWVSSKWGKTPTATKSVADLRSVASKSVATASRPPTVHSTTSPVMASNSADVIQSNAGSSASTGKRSVSATALSVSAAVKSADIPFPGSITSSGFFGRAPGINQSGPIPGFAAVIATRKVPTVVNPSTVDITGLKEGLKESLAEQ
ncbi:hypothetical protein LTS08_005045 [Lithohypha guttulata]|nr:hypothetical protein LTS08_005045 [Lithohypha guttulata]